MVNTLSIVEQFDVVKLGVDYGLTVSCYQADADARACGMCDSWRLRRAGFEGAGIADPTRYV